jgi:hypothetical protein
MALNYPRYHKFREDEDVINRPQDPEETAIGTGILAKILQIPENRVCAECSEPGHMSKIHSG